MKLIELIENKKPSLSFEVFPPKSTNSYASVKAAAESIAQLSPSFMSVTHGAGGATDEYTVSIATDLQNKYNVPTLAHLSCIHSSHESVCHQLDLMRRSGIDNILALRGDVSPKDKVEKGSTYRYASQLISEIRQHGDFCIGAACYPQAHPESRNQNVVAGIMPVINAWQIKRIIEVSGTALPQRFRYIVDHFGDYPEAMKQAGIAYATEQIVDLFANGVPAVHVYSMNNAAVAEKIWDNLSEIIK